MKLSIKFKSTSLNRKKTIVLGSFLLPGLLGVIGFVFLPFADVIRRSFCTSVSGTYCGFRNYITIFSNEAFGLAVMNTLKFVAVCLPLLLGLSLVLAYGISKSKYLKIFKSLYLLPMAIPIAAVVLIWKLLFDSNGILNYVIGCFGKTQIDFLGSDMYFWVLVFSYLWKNLGYTVVLWLAGIMNVSESILEAAKVDGAGEWKCFTKIIFPNLKSTMYMITILSFLNTFKVFREAYLVSGSYPQESMYMLQHLFNNWYTKMDLDKMSASAVVTAICLLIFVLILQRLWDREEIKS